MLNKEALQAAHAKFSEWADDLIHNRTLTVVTEFKPGVTTLDQVAEQTGRVNGMLDLLSYLKQQIEELPE